MSNGQIFRDDNNVAVVSLYDATGHQVVNWQAGPVSTDATTNQKYAPAAVDVTVTANNSSVGTNGSPAPTSSTFIGVTDGTNLRGIKDMSTVDDGSRNGILKAGLAIYHSDGSIQSVRDAAAAAGTNGTGVFGTALLGFDGTNFQLITTNQDGITLVASGARTTTQTSADQTNYNGRGVIVVLDMTNVGASPSVTLEIDGKDPVSGKYYPLLTGAAVTTVTTNVYTVYPGNTVAANVSASTVLPHTWRVKVTANNANSGTYSVGASIIV